MERQQLITSLCTQRGEKTLPRYNRSSDDIILTVTMNRLLIVCAEHYARGKVSDLKMYKLIIRQEKTFMSLIWLIKLLKKKPGEEKMPVTAKDRWWCQSPPESVRDDPFLDCTQHWWSWGWVHLPRLEMDWIHGSCWLHGWCIALPLLQRGVGALPQPHFCRKDWHSSSISPPALLLEGLLSYLMQTRITDCESRSDRLTSLQSGNRCLNS